MIPAPSAPGSTHETRGQSRQVGSVIAEVNFGPQGAEPAPAPIYCARCRLQIRFNRPLGISFCTIHGFDWGVPRSIAVAIEEGSGRHRPPVGRPEDASP